MEATVPKAKYDELEAKHNALKQELDTLAPVDFWQKVRALFSRDPRRTNVVVERGHGRDRRYARRGG